MPKIYPLHGFGPVSSGSDDLEASMMQEELGYLEGECRLSWTGVPAPLVSAMIPSLPEDWKARYESIANMGGLLPGLQTQAIREPAFLGQYHCWCGDFAAECFRFRSAARAAGFSDPIAASNARRLNSHSITSSDFSTAFSVIRKLMAFSVSDKSPFSPTMLYSRKSCAGSIATVRRAGIKVARRPKSNIVSSTPASMSGS